MRLAPSIVVVIAVVVVAWLVGRAAGWHVALVPSVAISILLTVALGMFTRRRR